YFPVYLFVVAYVSLASTFIFWRSSAPQAICHAFRAVSPHARTCLPVDQPGSPRGRRPQALASTSRILQRSVLPVALRTRILSPRNARTCLLRQSKRARTCRSCACNEVMAGLVALLCFCCTCRSFGERLSGKWK